MVVAGICVVLLGVGVDVASGSAVVYTTTASMTELNNWCLPYMRHIMADNTWELLVL